MVNPADYEEPGKGRAAKEFKAVKDKSRDPNDYSYPEKFRNNAPQLVLKPGGSLQRIVDEQVELEQTAIALKQEMEEKLEKEHQDKVNSNNNDKDNER
ncbi:MAG: hypothetical protein CBB62_11765 [Micavibrio sp. TMED2]|nr:hypothetical protein [Alphaproteobacteria bacterium]OUT39093.1 MAG: hypothetical protein CBB62_11765 [Micavibrio sp. TMED2]